MKRPDGRRPGQIRSVTIERGYTKQAPGSVLIRTGETVVLCTACWRHEVPKWRVGSGEGWLTAEYDMLPAATGERRNRNRQSIDGRTQEIQRLIGRALRSVVDLKKLGENTILVDCDVIQADGGTRTAAITGAYVAVVDAVRHAIRQKTIGQPPFVDSVAAVSVGIVGGRVVADLNYAEDSSADVDLNLVMTGGGTFVEIQGTAERGTFTQQMLDRMLRTGSRAVRELLEVQTRALKRKG